MHAPIQPMLSAPTDANLREGEFAKARDLIVDVPYREAATDGYIDDAITMVVDHEGWAMKAVNAAPLAIHALFRPVDRRDPLPREEAVSMRKLSGEGTPDEIKVVLGWRIDTRAFRIHLPMEKASDWLYSIREILTRDTVDEKTLERIAGRLNHAAHVIPQGRYFLNRIRHLMERCGKFGPRPITLGVKQDLELWMDLLEYTSRRGVDLNNVPFSRTDIDLCAGGM